MRTNQPTVPKSKKIRFRKQPAFTLAAPHEAGDSEADLRKVISDLELAIAEHERTNAFLRDLLTEKWFDVPAEEFAGKL
jgi:hypothetical protein